MSKVDERRRCEVTVSSAKFLPTGYYECAVFTPAFGVLDMLPLRVDLGVVVADEGLDVGVYVASWGIRRCVGIVAGLIRHFDKLCLVLPIGLNHDAFISNTGQDNEIPNLARPILRKFIRALICTK